MFRDEPPARSFEDRREWVEREVPRRDRDRDFVRNRPRENREHLEKNERAISREKREAPAARPERARRGTVSPTGSAGGIHSGGIKRRRYEPANVPKLSILK